LGDLPRCDRYWVHADEKSWRNQLVNARGQVAELEVANRVGGGRERMAGNANE
jgi:hypothetical protein